MTQVSIHAAEQSSRLNGFISGALMSAVLLLSVVLIFSPFAA